MNTDTIHIAYTSSRMYISFVTISIHSILESNPDTRFHFHVLGEGLTDVDVNNIKSILPAGRTELSVYPLTNLRGMLTIDVPKEFPMIAYARLFLQSVLPEYVDRVIYMDGDTVVRGDLMPFYQSEIGEALVGGIIDPLISTAYKQRTGIPADEPYINAGVLLIPLSRWRREDLQGRFLSILQKNNGTIYMFDQGLVNIGCRGRKCLLSPKYDMMTNYLTYSYRYLKRYNNPFYSKDIVDEAVKNPVLIHFTGRLYGRPWEVDCIHPYKELYLHHKAATAYRDNPIQPCSVKGVDKIGVKLYRNMPFLFYSIFMRALFFVTNFKHSYIKKDNTQI